MNRGIASPGGARWLLSQLADALSTTCVLGLHSALVSIALFGIVVEACFIYHLYTTKQNSELLHDTPQTDARKVIEDSTVPPKTSLPSFKEPSKPLAHLTAGSERPGADGVMPWSDKVDLELHELKYKENKLVVEKEGFYYIYSKLCFDADEVSFHHLMVMTTPRHTGPTPIELLRYRYHADHSKPLRKVDSTQNSYLGGVFHLFKGDAVFVVVKSGTVRLQTAADNYFGMFMV